VIARAALVLAVVAVGLSIWALARPGGSSGGRCGVVHQGTAGTAVACTGKDVPPFFLWDVHSNRAGERPRVLGLQAEEALTLVCVECG
jgi:hypothetical protein